MSRSGTDGSYGSSSFGFSGTSILISIVAAPVGIPTSSASGFPSLYAAPSAVVFQAPFISNLKSALSHHPFSEVVSYIYCMSLFSYQSLRFFPGIPPVAKQLFLN